MSFYECCQFFTIDHDIFAKSNARFLVMFLVSEEFSWALLKLILLTVSCLKDAFYPLTLSLIAFPVCKTSSSKFLKQPHYIRAIQMHSCSERPCCPLSCCYVS